MSKGIHSALRLSSLSIVACTIALLVACNSSDKPKTTTEDTTTPEKINATGTTTMILPVRLTGEKLRALFQSSTGSNDIKMIYFEYDDTRYPGGLSLNAYGADENGIRVTNNIALDTVGHGNSLTYTGSGNMPGYSQAVTRGHIKVLFGLPTGTNSPANGSRFRDAWMTPCQNSSSDLIEYVITFPSATVPTCPTSDEPNAMGRVSTNPTPPGNPCRNDCDNPNFTLTAPK